MLVSGIRKMHEELPHALGLRTLTCLSIAPKEAIQRPRQREY